jgi:hypothetical protein
MEEFAVGDGAHPRLEGPAPPGGAIAPGSKEGGLGDVVSVWTGAGKAAGKSSYGRLVAGDQFAKGSPVARHRGACQFGIGRVKAARHA